MTVNIKLTHPNAEIPKYHTPGSAGFDLAIVEDVVLEYKTPQLCDTGLVIETPENYFLLITPRSSTFKKWGVSLGNTIGIVDSDYSGNDDHIKLNLNWEDRDEWNGRGGIHLHIPAGTRLAQGLFIPVRQAEFYVVEDMNQQSRGGWGSTG